jgi:hypothetical protein
MHIGGGLRAMKQKDELQITLVNEILVIQYQHSQHFKTVMKSIITIKCFDTEATEGSPMD